MLRYAVIGSGAVGGFYGIRLAKAGADVQFLLRREVAQVRARGMELESPEGDIRLAEPRVAGSWDELERCDVLLIAVKATANADVLAQLARHADRLVAPGGGILLVQNGIGAEPAFAAASRCAVLGGLAFLCANRIRPGVVRHLDFGALTIAAHDPSGAAAGISPLMRAIADDLARAGTKVHLDDDLIRARWRKLMWNIPFNPLSVILDATTDELMGDADTVELVRVIMTEVAAAAFAEGRTLPDGLIDDLLAATARMAPYATSMKLDADAGRPLEVEAMLAEPLRRAARTGTAMPSVAVLHRELAFLDARGQRRSSPQPAAQTPPRLFAIDVDGTLLTTRHEVTAATVAAVRRARARGVEIVLTTSRPPRALWPILAALGLTEDVGETTAELAGERAPAVFIGSQGALVGSYSADGELQVLDQQPMPVALAQEVAVVGARAGASVNWYAGERWLVPRMDDLIRREAAIVGCEPELCDLALQTQGPDKVLLIAPDGQRDLLDGVAARTPPGLAAVTSNPTYLEITRAGVDKAGALARHCARRGIPTSAVVAIGDGRNDLGMLDLAGVAVAPANAHPEVLRVADLITASNDEDGVARALDLLVP